MGFEQLTAGVMVRIIGVDVGIEGPSVDEQGYRLTSLRRISSIRSETSWRPERPAAAPSSRRRPPACKWVSIASRVTSETVMPRRAASWRSLASSSSESFTVVRRTVCQHTMPPRAQEVMG